MKIPTRLSIALTTAITGLMALSAEVAMSHTAHVACVIAGGFVLGLLVHPGEAGTVTTAAAPPYTVGLTPATPPAPVPAAVAATPEQIAAAAAARTLP